MARMLAGFPEQAAVSVPRRAGKTVGLWAHALGMCEEVPGYQVHFTAQSGLKARARWDDVVTALEAVARARGVASRVHVARSSGREQLTWPNGSRVMVMPPKAESFRGEESDLWWLDEAQELDADHGRELVSAVAPTQDTRPRPTMLVSGTAGASRDGILWTWLERGRAGEAGIVEYAAPDGADPDDEATWWAAHPGLAYGSTPIERMRRNHADPDLDYRREYLGWWPVVTGTHLIDPHGWADLGVLALPDRPEKGAGLVFALDCDAHQRWASIVAAQPAADKVGLEVIRREDGIGWVARTIYDLARRYPHARFAWDGMPANTAATQELEKAKPRPKHTALSFNEMKDAAAGIVLAITEGRVQHYHQPDLTGAVEQATARRIGDTGFLFARGGLDVTALVAASVALHVVDRQKVRQPLRIRSVGMTPDAESA